MSRIVPAVLALVVTAMTLAPATLPPAWAAFPGANGAVAFDSNRSGNYDVWKVNADRTGLVQLTTSSSSDVGPTWSADGSKIAFTSYRTGGGDVYYMNADGSNQTRFTTSSYFDGYPTWSPDGTKLAFASIRSGNLDVFVAKVATGEVRQLTNGLRGRLRPSLVLRRIEDRVYEQPHGELGRLGDEQGRLEPACRGGEP